MIRNGFSRQECEAHSLLLLLSGTESTACAIRAVLGYIITTPLVYLKLKQEITSAICHDNISFPITFAQAKRLPYLQVSTKSSSDPPTHYVNVLINVGGDIRRHPHAHPSARLMAQVVRI